MLFIYDGSFEGLLTCIFEAYRFRVRPEIVSAEKHQEQLFSKPKAITTDNHKAERVIRKLQAISPEVQKTVQYCYLSNNSHKETIILNYIQQILLSGRRANSNYGDPAISTALDCRHSVGKEAHRFKGFLRFQELQDGSWYAACEPEHCILPLLVSHCRGRFPEQQWIIHDVKRDLAMFCRRGELQLYTHTELANLQEQLSEPEKQYQLLWKTFFKNIAITERRNPQLQRQFMPKKYWKYLVEKN